MSKSQIEGSQFWPNMQWLHFGFSGWYRWRSFGLVDIAHIKSLLGFIPTNQTFFLGMTQRALNSNYAGYRLNHCHVIWQSCDLFYFKAPRQWVCPRCGTPESRPPCGSSTKCLRIVTLQSSCKRHWLHTSWNLMQTQSWGWVCMARGMERFATADCFVTLPLNWANFKRNKKTVLWRPWTVELVNSLIVDQILLKWEEIDSVSLLVRCG